jgi:hypothetical protein
LPVKRSLHELPLDGWADQRRKGLLLPLSCLDEQIKILDEGVGRLAINGANLRFAWLQQFIPAIRSDRNLFMILRCLLQTGGRVLGANAGSGWLPTAGGRDVLPA